MPNSFIDYVYETGASLTNDLYEGVNYVLGSEHIINIYNSAKIALSSDVAANFILWSFGFGPTYYGWKCIAFTFISGTLKYWGRKEINDYLGEDYYHFKHIIAGAFGGGFYYASNYLFKTILDNNILFNKFDLLYKLINGAINNIAWEYFSETLQDLKNKNEWLEYSKYVYSIETFDCFFSDNIMSCIILKQPIGTISRTYGAYIREKIKNKYSESNSDKITEFIYYYNVIHITTGVGKCVEEHYIANYSDAIEFYDIEYDCVTI